MSEYHHYYFGSIEDVIQLDLSNTATCLHICIGPAPPETDTQEVPETGPWKRERLVIQDDGAK
jgi:hypothetical protein